MKIKQIKPVTAPYPFEAYAHVVAPLSEEDGGGYMITFPDLPGCMSDGDTLDEVLSNGRDAFTSWGAALGGLVGAAVGAEKPEEKKEGKFSDLVLDAIRSGHVVLVAQTRTEAETTRGSDIVGDSVVTVA